MKQILFVLLLIPFYASAQIDTFEFKLIDTLDAPKQEIYSRARQFIALEFKDAKDNVKREITDQVNNESKNVAPQAPAQQVSSGTSVNS